MTSPQLIVILGQLYGEMQPQLAEPLAVSTLAAHLNQLDLNLSTTLALIDPSRNSGSISEFVNSITHPSQTVLALSAPQGTLSVAKEILRSIHTRHGVHHPRIVLGNSLPTHIPQEFLSISPRALIIRGWGEIPLEMYLRQVLHGPENWSKIPGVSYLDQSGTLISTPISVRSPDSVVTAPIRAGEAGRFARRVESSRECRFGECSFCTRPTGQRLPWTQVHHDVVRASLEGLSNLGEKSFSFTDEDFLGHTPADALRIARISNSLGFSHFACSARVASINSAGRAHSLFGKPPLTQLRDLGLAMVFTGIESLTDSQLRRYNKGVTVAQAVTAIQVLENSGTDFELGFIMFDPLATPYEILENVRLLRLTGAWRRVGAQFSRLRLQIDSPGANDLRYRHLIRDINLEYATQEWDFAHPETREIYQVVQEYWHVFDQVYWLASNLYRSSMGTGPWVSRLRPFLEGIRGINLELLDRVTRSVLRDDPATAFTLAHQASAAARRLTACLARTLEMAGPAAVLSSWTTR